MTARSSPIVIAHRGACGYLPEHTTEAKVLAHAMGADYIEQDVVATRDAGLVVLHDVFLDDVTNVAEMFPGRARLDGRHYAIDFDLAEICKLRVVERRRSGTQEQLYPTRFGRSAPHFRVATLMEEIELILGLNETTGREIGIYPEIKEPVWHREHGIDLSALLVEELRRHGYGDGRPAYVQCFDAEELRRLSVAAGPRLPLIQLLPARGEEPSNVPSAEALAEIAAYAAGVGVPIDWLARHDGANVVASPVLHALRAAGLLIHAYTFRRESLPGWARSLDELLHTFLSELRVDGVFCDYPDVAVRARNSMTWE